MVDLSYARCLGLSPAVSAHFNLALCAATENCNSTKNPYFGVSWFFEVIDVDTTKSLSLLLAMISSMSLLR